MLNQSISETVISLAKSFQRFNTDRFRGDRINYDSMVKWI